MLTENVKQTDRLLSAWLDDLYEKQNATLPQYRLKIALTHLRDHFQRHYDIIFSWTSKELPREESALVEVVEERSDILKCRETMIGASSLKYFTTPNPTTSKEKKYLNQLDYGSEVSPDAFLRRILRSESLPEDLRKLDIQLNTKLFYSKQLPNICSIPDGTCYIDGVLSPVELMTNKAVIDKFTGYNASRKDADRRRAGNQVTSKDIAFKKGSYAGESDSDYESRKSKKEVSKRRLSNRAISKSARKIPTNRIISEKTQEEKSLSSFENRSRAQSERSYLRSLKFINSIPNTFLYDKKMQVNAAMMCMMVEKSLLLYWDIDAVYYIIHRANASEFFIKLLGINKNISDFFESHRV
jgi:hypothetical protein